MSLRPTLLIVPSSAAAVELPRRLAQVTQGIAGLFPLTLRELAKKLAEPQLLGRGLLPWDTGHDALIAARLLARGHGLQLAPNVPLRSVAVPLARTLAELRGSAVSSDALLEAANRALTTEDQARLRALAELYTRYVEDVEGRFADPATLFREATLQLQSSQFLDGARALVAGSLEFDPLEAGFLAALARRIPVSSLDDPVPENLVAQSFRAWAPRNGVTPVAAQDTLLAPIETPPTSALLRLREQLFEAPTGNAIADDGSLELVTAPGEAAEVRAMARRILREAARGVPFEEMGIAFAHSQTYAPLVTDLLARLRIPVKLHPSLPLRHGPAARSLLLLFRCRELPRAAVMEFLTFAPIPFASILGSTEPSPERWDVISRDAGIVSGAERWSSALQGFADSERVEATKDPNSDRRARRLQRVLEAETLRLVVDRLQVTLELLSGVAPWPEWSRRLSSAVGQWIGDAPDRDAVLRVIADLGGLQALEAQVEWDEVEHVIEARFEWERVPLAPVAEGAVHAGVLDAIAGMRFRVLMFVGLVEGGFPGVLRPDPLLLDKERLGLRAPLRRRSPRAERRAPSTRQLSLFDAPLEAPRAELDASASLPTTQDKLLEQRRLFHRACSQATEKLVLSYPRADPRSGRERLPSLFFVAAAQALHARTLATAELARLIVEDDLRALPLELALDSGERDLMRVRRGGREAALQIAAGSRFFRHSHLASEARWSRDFTPYDGLVALPPRDGEDAEAAGRLRERLDPIAARGTVSASRLARYASCGFQYYLENVLRLEPTLEPEERKRLEPLERGSLFHDVAERFLRELRDNGLLPVRDSQAERQRLTEMAEDALARHVADHPPRFKLLWDRECRRFKETLLVWLAREARAAEHSTPAFFEVGFGPSPGGEAGPGEPHMQEPLEIDLGDGRALRVSGRIDRIDRRPDGKLVLRDYKTGRAPKDEAGLFRGGRQLQIPFYVLAAAKIFPDQPVVQAFLDYVDGGRQVALDLNVVQNEPFRNLLRGLIDGIAGGVFVQEPAICDWCDFTMVCGPKTLIGLRRERKRQDPRIVKALGLKHL